KNPAGAPPPLAAAGDATAAPRGGGGGGPAPKKKSAAPPRPPTPPRHAPTARPPDRLTATVPAARPRRPHPRRSVNSSISGGVNTRIGTPTTPMPRLTYS